MFQRLQITINQTNVNEFNFNRQFFKSIENNYCFCIQRAYSINVKNNVNNENDERTNQNCFLDNNFNFENN